MEGRGQRTDRDGNGRHRSVCGHTVESGVKGQVGFLKTNRGT